ncbi:methyltransferase family protein [Bacteroidota bacterium]
MIIFEVCLIILLFLIFGFSHTILASNKVKLRIVEQIGSQIAYYRLFYNIISLLMFFVILQIAPRPDVIIYDLQYPFDLMMVGIQVLSLFGLVWSVRGIDMKEFTGLSQVVRYQKGNYNIKDLDEKILLHVKGAFQYTRHPVYFFCIIFFGFRPTMDLFYLIMFLFMVAYFYIGSYYEERKLVEKFGDKYRNYQSEVPRIIPVNFFKK